MKFLLLLIVRIHIFISNKGSEKGSDSIDLYCVYWIQEKEITLEMDCTPKVRQKKSNIGVFYNEIELWS